MEKPAIDNELKDYSLLKVFALLLVIFGHSNYVVTKTAFGGVDYSSFYIHPTTSYRWIEFVITTIYTFHMPLFVFISGALYYFGNIQLKKNYNFQTLIKKKFNRLLIPYFLAAIFYMIPIKTLSHFYSLQIIPKAIEYGIFLGLDSGHLWYLFMLFNLFIIFHFLERFFNDSNEILNLVIMILLYFFSNKLPTNLFEIWRVMQYLIYFYMGYLFQKNKTSILNIFKKNTIFWFLGFFVYFIILNLYWRDYLGGINEPTLILFIDSILGIISSYLLILNLMQANILKNNIIKLLDKYNFEIYLLHDPINYLILAIFSQLNLFQFFNRKSIYSILPVIMRFFITLITPIIIVFLVKKIKTLRDCLNIRQK